RQRGESVKGDTRPAAEVHRFFHQCGGQLDRFWQIIELDSIAIRVGAQCYVAQLREPLRAALGILTEAERLRHHENSRALAALLFIVGEISAKGYVAVFVIQSLSLHLETPFWLRVPQSIVSS